MTNVVKTTVAVSVLAVAAGQVFAAQKLVASVPVGNVVVDNPAATALPVNFGAAAAGVPISGFGLSGTFSGINVDNSDGLWPWSLDLAVGITSPDSQFLQWGSPIAGDRTFSDYPIQDFTGGFTNAQATGTWNLNFTDTGPSTAASFEIQNASVHLMTQVPDVVTPVAADVTTGPQWSRPFAINGVSSLGPVFYEAVTFTVSESGGYVFDTSVSSGNAFTFLYADGFDPSLPLENLLDYGLGNGSSPFGVPPGQSLIEALLFEGVEYTFVMSQWDRFAGSATQSYTGSITGPGTVVIPEPGSLIGLTFAACGLLRRRQN